MYNYILITIDKWSGSPTCQSSSYIDSLIDSLEVNFIISDYYFDLNDYSNPIKSTYNDRLNYYGVRGITKKAEIRMKRNDISDQK